MGRATLHRSAVERLAAQLGSLDVLLHDVPADAIERRSPSGKWSARENLAHLARYHEVFLERVLRILNEDKPRFGRYRAEDDPEWPKWERMTLNELRKRLKKLRRQVLAVLNQATPEELARTGIHPAFGEMSIPFWVEFFLAHEGHHLYSIFQRLRERA